MNDVIIYLCVRVHACIYLTWTSFTMCCLCLLQTELALRFELTGGFIKNAILSALSIAVSRDGDNPVVCQKDLLQGARASEDEGL